jgi:hypothetical protein
MVPLTAPLFGVLSLKGCFSLKNWTQRVILRHDTTSFKYPCFLIKLKALLSGLYVFNRLSNIPVST